jgi:hypothetical protein
MAIGRPVSLTSNVASKVISVTATASQTLFTVEGGYRINALSVYRNGVRLTEQDYTARDGASVTLLSPASGGDTLEFQIFDDFRVADAIVSAESDQTIYGNLTVTGTLTGSTIGIQSAGTSVGSATTLNFIGVGNTFAVNGNTIDISIAGGGGGESGISTTGVSTAAIWSNPSFITTSYTLDDGTNNYGVFGPISVAVGATITVGAGNTFVIV